MAVYFSKMVATMIGSSLSDLQVSWEIFPVSESQCGLINILHSLSQNILN